MLAVDNEADALALFNQEVQRIQSQIDAGTWESDKDAITATHLNIGWCFGEGMPADRIAMWVKVCGAYHPFFGDKPPQLEDAIRFGEIWGKANEK